MRTCAQKKTEYNKALTFMVDAVGALWYREQKRDGANSTKTKEGLGVDRGKESVPSGLENENETKRTNARWMYAHLFPPAITSQNPPSTLSRTALSSHRPTTQ